MAESLIAVESVFSQQEGAATQASITPIKSTGNEIGEKYPTNSEKPSPESVEYEIEENTETIDSPEKILNLLRSEPPTKTLLVILATLSKDKPFRKNNFSLFVPGPIQAQIISCLVTKIIPLYWWVIKDLNHRKYLISCLSNIAGFGAIVAKINKNLDKIERSREEGSSHIKITNEILEVASELFRGDAVLRSLLRALRNNLSDEIKIQLSWKEFVTLVGSGKVITAIARAEDSSKAISGSADGPCWLANGAEYSAWLGRNIASLITEKEENIQPAAQMFSKALYLGNQPQLLDGLFGILVSHQTQEPSVPSPSQRFVGTLAGHVRKGLLEQTFRWLSSITTTDATRVISTASTSPSKKVSAIAAFLSQLYTDDVLRQHIFPLLKNAGFSASISLEVRRGCLAAISTIRENDFDSLLEDLIATFGDRVFINHAPAVQQESVAQTLLMTAGYLHRQSPMAVLMHARSSHHLKGVSNRLDSSHPRARWLGMVVGTALSSLVDREGTSMSFGTDDMATSEAVNYRQLVRVADSVGSLADFKDSIETMKRNPLPNGQSLLQKPREMPRLNGKPVFGPVPPPAQTEVTGEKVSEIIDDEEDFNGNDLKPHAKPDSDAEDSDEDATLVNRNKIRAPVYIRDLMSMLRDDSNAERFQIGIKHAAGVIRRKTSFGTEVKDHAEELARILCNLQDPFSTDNFDGLRLQAMIAVLLSDAKTMSPWFARQAFAGEYGIAQRCIILSALGLGGRELAGLKEEDELNPALSHTDFPSKRLPAHLHSLYTDSSNTSPTTRLEAATKDTEHQLIQPLALQAADKRTAHLNQVKVRTFSSLAARTKKRKPAPNQLARIFGPAFLFPLANRYQQETASSAVRNPSEFSRVPFLLVTFLKTVALLLHASGPATTDLPRITEEIWELLLSLRTQAALDISILQAVLFALLALLEVNADDRQRVARENPRQLMETRRWVELIFERTAGVGGGGGGNGNVVSDGGNEDETKVRTLAAGVLVKTGEIAEMYQRELIGFSSFE